MKRFGQVINVKPEGRQEYIKLHEKIPPEIAELIRVCNIRNYSIFIRNNMLFAYYEYVGMDYERDMQKMEDSNNNKKWWDLVKPLMQPLGGRKEGEFWCDMDSVFFLE